MKPKIFAVDDHAMSRTLIRAALSTHYDVRLFEDGSTFLQALDGRPEVDLFLLDIILPDVDGYELCTRVRSNPNYQNTPLLFLSGKSEVAQKVMGLTLGADDYLTKPFHSDELLARIQARLRRQAEQRSSVLEFKDFQIDQRSHRVFIKSKEINLTKREFDLIAFLASEPDCLRTRAAILEAVWSNDINVTERTVDSHISKLRKKLGPFAACIESVHAEGYRFVPPDRAQVAA